MLAFLASIRKHRRLVSDLVRRDLHARYVGSTMGFFWSVIFPIINLCVYLFVFRFVLKMRWSDQQGDTEVALLMLSGILVWQAFAESTMRMTNALVDNANLIQKVIFPSESLPVYLTLSSLVNMAIGIVVAILCVCWFAYVKPGPPRPATPAVSIRFDTNETISIRGTFRCASTAASTKYTAHSVSDGSVAAWQQPFAEWKAGTILNAGWSDIVYSTSGEWAKVLEKEGLVLRVDRWRNLAGEDVDPPRDGVQAFVLGEPERPIGLSISLVCLPILILLQGIFMLGVGCVLSTFNLFVRDTYHVIGVVLTVWMFATPIFYPERLVHNSGYGWVPGVNPVSWLISCYREVLVYGAWPDPLQLLRFAAAGLLLLVLGSAFFMRHKPRFPDLL